MQPATSYRVLIVDDNEELLKAVSFALQTVGDFDIITANDGITGLKQAAIAQPHCIVIDVKMPGLNGYQLVRALRGDPDTAEIPMIILSAMVQEDDIATGMISGVDQYLTKPFNVEALIQAIQRAVTITPEEREQQLIDLFNDTV